MSELLPEPVSDPADGPRHMAASLMFSSWCTAAKPQLSATLSISPHSLACSFFAAHELLAKRQPDVISHLAMKEGCRAEEQSGATRKI